MISSITPGRDGKPVRKPRSRRVPGRLWSPESGERIPWDIWRGLDAAQQPFYAGAERLRDVTAQLRRQPPLVFTGGVDDLRTWMGAAARGKAFVLMGRDCAETFAEATADHVHLKIQTLLQMTVVLTYGASLPVIKVGCIVGQYAKPRPSDMEARDGVALSSHRGDVVNSFEFAPETREPGPQRLLSLYNHAAPTLNLIRAFTKGGYADLRQVRCWNQGFISNPTYAHYGLLTKGIHRAIRFIGAAGVDFKTLRDVDLHSSHEVLLFRYESAMTRIDSRTGEPYNTSTRFLWAGEQTHEEKSTHIKLLSCIRNSIGVKLGPSIMPDQMLSFVDRLSPNGGGGHLSFITRINADHIHGAFPPLLETARKDGRPFTQITDPIHGNTITSSTGCETRRFETVMDEARGFFETHEASGTVPGGLHVELTSNDVTEVIGGSERIDDESLRDRYETLVDPRLNHQQSLEVVFQVTQHLAKCSSHEE